MFGRNLDSISLLGKSRRATHINVYLKTEHITRTQALVQSSGADTELANDWHASLESQSFSGA